MRSAKLSLFAGALAVLALAGCGGDDKEGAKPEAGGPSPQETLRAAQAAIREVDSYRVQGTQTDPEGTTELTADVSGTSVKIELSRGKGSAASMVIVDEITYLRGNEAFWDETAGAEIPAAIHDRWVRLPKGDDSAELAEELQPETIAACLADRNGTLSAKGTEEVDGREVDVIADAGDKPGTAPGELFVAADDPRLPLRVRQTGPRREGGAAGDPKCTNEDDDTPTLRSDVTLSRFDEPIEIEAPADALDLEDVARQAGEQSTV